MPMRRRFLVLLATLPWLHAAVPAAPAELLVVGATPPAVFTLSNKTPAGFIVPLANLAAWVDSRSKEQRLNEQLRGEGGAFAQELARTLTDRVLARLIALGQPARLAADVPRPEGAPDDLDLTRLAPALGSELLLQLWISETGFLSRRFNPDYVPRLNVRALLYRASRGDWPYDGELYYGVDARSGKDWAVESEARFAFRSFDALLGDLPLARESLQAGIEPLADRIARQVHDALQAH